jgi:hypothetical protein
VVLLGYAVSNAIEFPEMRAEVICALRSLSDLDYQRERWGRYEPGISFYDDLDLNIHILYDDAAVLPDPEPDVPALLYVSEVGALRSVDAVLSPIISELGDAADSVYMSHPRWPEVARAAAEAFALMKANDDEARTTMGQLPSCY